MMARSLTPASACTFTTANTSRVPVPSPSKAILETNCSITALSCERSDFAAVAVFTAVFDWVVQNTEHVTNTTDKNFNRAKFISRACREESRAGITYHGACHREDMAVRFLKSGQLIIGRQILQMP